MRIALSEVTGLSQRLQMLSTQEDPDYANSSVIFQRDEPSIVPQIAPSKPLPRSAVEREIAENSRHNFDLINGNLSGLRLLRAQRLQDMQNEEIRLQKEREAKLRAEAEEREKREKERRAAEEKKRKEEEDARKAREAAKLAAEKAAKEKQEKEAKEKAEKEQERLRVEKEKAEKEKEEKEEKLRAEKAKAEEAKPSIFGGAKAAAAPAAGAASSAASAGNAESGSGDASASLAASLYAQHMSVIKYCKETVNPSVSKDKQLYSTCFQLRGKITTVISQLTPSRSQIQKSIAQLKEVLETAKSLGDMGFQYILNQMSKAFVRQASEETGVAVASAMPFALVMTMLWAAHPELGKFLLARFVKRDPYIIGYSVSTDTNEGRKRMGYKQIDEGKWESDVHYGERIGGITALWSVMTITKLNVNSGQKHPYPVSNSWKFVALQLNTPTEKLTNGHFCAMHAWWEVAGSRFLEAYGAQAKKLLMCVCEDWTQSVADKPFPTAKALKIAGNEWKSSGELKVAWKPLGP